MTTRWSFKGYIINWGIPKSMKTRKGFGFLSLMLFAGMPAHAEIYKWIDSSGGVHYSDIPHQGAELMVIPGIQSFTPPPAETKPDESQTVGSAEAAKVYKSLAIVQPANQATIRNNQGYVLINVAIEPALQDGDLLQIIFDGNPFGKPQANLSFALSNINRGTHTLAVQVLDKHGNVILKSKPIKFFMHRPRVNMGGV